MLMKENVKSHLAYERLKMLKSVDWNKEGAAEELEKFAPGEIPDGTARE
jgi:hypothetical protein